jgi:hypothetical protein
MCAIKDSFFFPKELHIDASTFSSSSSSFFSHTTASSKSILFFLKNIKNIWLLCQTYVWIWHNPSIQV